MIGSTAPMAGSAEDSRNALKNNKKRGDESQPGPIPKMAGQVCLMRPMSLKKKAKCKHSSTVESVIILKKSHLGHQVNQAHPGSDDASWSGLTFILLFGIFHP